MKRLRIATFLVVFGFAFSTIASSQTAEKAPAKQVAAKQDDIPKSIAASVSGPLKFAEGSFLSVAEAMPEDKYSYVPTTGNFDGVRSFGEQVKHVACAQFAFFKEFEGKAPPDDCEKGGQDPARTKAELIKYLKDSFDYSNGVVAKLTAKNALDRVEGRYAGPNTKLGISRRTRYVRFARHRCGVRVAYYRPLWTACRVPANERPGSAHDAKVRAEGAVICGRGKLVQHIEVWRSPWRLG